MIYYRQCTLQRGNAFTTTWLPENFAKKGKYIKLKDSNGVWVNGWVVKEVGDNRKPEESVKERSQDFKHQRKASDI